MTLQTCAPENFLHVDGGPSGGSSVCSPGSKDPHWRERKLLTILELAELEQDFYINPYNTKTSLTPKKWPLYSAGNTFTRPQTGVGVKNRFFSRCCEEVRKYGRTVTNDIHPTESGYTNLQEVMMMINSVFQMIRIMLR